MGSENTKEEMVSVIMPTYNACDFLSQSIEGVLNQTYKNLELLITDDCSTDPKIKLILQDYQQRDSRVKVFLLDCNGGAGVARNNCIEKAEGRYIAFCDSDDCWEPTKLEKQLELMHQTGCSLSYTFYTEHDERGSVKGVLCPPEKLTFHDMLHDNKMGFSTVVYDTHAYGKFYMPTLRKRQDWALLLSILKKAKVAFGVPEMLTRYTLCPASLSHSKLKLIPYEAKVYQLILNYAPWRSYLYVFFVFLPCYALKKLKKRCDTKAYLKSSSGI